MCGPSACSMACTIKVTSPATTRHAFIMAGQGQRARAPSSASPASKAARWLAASAWDWMPSEAMLNRCQRLEAHAPGVTAGF